MAHLFTDKRKDISRMLVKLIPFFLAITLWCILVFREQFYLKKVENLSLFLFDWQFILNSFKTPGGFLGLAGSFLTQFLHMPWLGALLWVSLLFVAYRYSVRALRIPDSLTPLALIPIALLIIGNMSLGYGIFIMREQDHFFAPVLGYMVSLVPVALIGRFKSVPGRAAFLAVWITAGYILTGIFAPAGALAAVLGCFADRNSSRRESLTALVLTIVLIIMVPIVIYPAYTTYRMADSWHMGLPAISDESWSHAMRAPFQLALLCQIILAVITPHLKLKELTSVKETAIQSAIYLAVIVITCGFWFRDENFHTELAMSDAVDRLDWQSVTDIYAQAANSHIKSDAKAYASRTDRISSAGSDDEIADIVDRYSARFFEPTRTMVMYRDLALFKTDRALDEAFTMKDGGRPQKSRTQISMAYQSGKQLYLHYGLVNMCYRWCMEDIIEHGWNYSTLRYMTMYAATTGEESLADKHLSKLSKTLFYRKWAGSQKGILSDRSQLAQTAPYDRILPMLCFEDRMSNDMGKPELHIISHFSGRQPDNATPEYDRAALLFAMRAQDISKFWERLYYYISSNKVRNLPVPVQQAALLYSSLEKDGMELPYDKSVKDSYDAFTKYVSSHPIRTMEEAKYPYSQKFGKSFYYYYYFIRNLKTY